VKEEGKVKVKMKLKGRQRAGAEKIKKSHL